MTDDEFTDSVGSSLDHLRTLSERTARLEALLLETQRQVCHRIGVERRAGRLSDFELRTLYQRYWEACGQRPGFGLIWTTETGVSTTGLRSRFEGRNDPNQPDGSYRGTFPLGDQARPKAGVPVVYVLYDEHNEPCYVGSTNSLAARLRQHGKDGKTFTSWAAWPCADREEAYQREEEMLQDVLPYLNRKAAR